jgi:hypothetical protein
MANARAGSPGGARPGRVGSGGRVESMHRVESAPQNPQNGCGPGILRIVRILRRPTGDQGRVARACRPLAPRQGTEPWTNAEPR